MSSISNIIFYSLAFFSVYAQVFFLITFLENRKKIVIRKGPTKLLSYPKVTIIVPCWNEERTIAKTVESLLGLDYPKDKLEIFLVDDGSTDRTWEVIKQFERYENIKCFQKENGGKYTALNLGLEHTTSDFVGCLDADSFADKHSLSRIMSYFEKDQKTMAVAPSIIAYSPKGIIQAAQKAEYYMAVFMKKMLGFMGAIHVTPGPLTIFRRQVFLDLGPYKHAHNTEDMEIAYRMQKNRYKIEQCNDAYVYTNTPHTIPKLFRQRLRWIYGFINNTIDYKGVIFKRKYGYFSTFTLPAGVLSIFATSFLFGRVVYNFGHFIYEKIITIKTVGISLAFEAHKFDFFFMNMKTFFFLFIFIYAWVITSIILGRRIAEGKWGISMDLVYFFSIFGLVAPLWLMKAVYNTIVAKAPSWR